MSTIHIHSIFLNGTDTDIRYPSKHRYEFGHLIYYLYLFIVLINFHKFNPLPSLLISDDLQSRNFNLNTYYLILKKKKKVK